MHECPDCGQQCDCDGEDHGQPAPLDCDHCDISKLDIEEVRRAFTEDDEDEGGWATHRENDDLWDSAEE